MEDTQCNFKLACYYRCCHVP